MKGGEQMQSAEDILNNIEKAYKWRIETAQQLAAEPGLNASELLTIYDKLTTANLLADILAAECPEKYGQLPAEHLQAAKTICPAANENATEAAETAPLCEIVHNYAHFM